MSMKQRDENGNYVFEAVIHEVPDKGGAYVVFPWNIREALGKRPGDTVRVTVSPR